MARIPSYEDWQILDRRVVGMMSPDGTSLQWWYVVEDDGTFMWHPYVVAPDTLTILEAPVWAPLPGSQVNFLNSPIYETLIHGNRGPGKTVAMLMSFASLVGKGWNDAWRGVLFRKTFRDLDDAVRKVEEIFPKIFPDFRFLKSKSEYRAEWGTGEALLFRHLLNEDEYDGYHGHEYPWMGFEELTQWETDKAFLKMMSCSRPTKQGIPTMIRASCNPSGVGHHWVKKRYGLPQCTDEVIRVQGEMPRIAIKSDLEENFLLLTADPLYRTKVRQASSTKAQADAWLLGSWDITSGGLLDDLWRPDVHVIPNFAAALVPRGWVWNRSYDHGQARPFSQLWWAESNGEPIQLPDGRMIGQVNGDKVLFAEWYGTSGVENEGLRMAATAIAKGILDREDDLGLRGRCEPGPADTEIWGKDSRGTGIAPVDDMEDEGLYWDKADKSAGSKVRGVQVMRSLLEGSVPHQDGTRDKPGFFVCQRCTYWLALVPQIPRDRDKPDEWPEKYEDHPWDSTRYRITQKVGGNFRREF